MLTSSKSSNLLFLFSQGELESLVSLLTTSLAPF